MNSFLDELAQVILNIHDKEQVKKFLVEILTENEIKDLHLRWELLKKLHAGESQRDIAKELKISLCRITRGSKILKSSDSIIKAILETAQVSHKTK